MNRVFAIKNFSTLPVLRLILLFLPRQSLHQVFFEERLWLIESIAGFELARRPFALGSAAVITQHTMLAQIVAVRFHVLSAEQAACVTQDLI